ncbi:MAG: class I SAM-dependent methyltransferase [Chlorobiaceae bacterium]|nr:class I SAM-dependent methyltransferase [Chlorobiaceae bacterium]
MPDNNWSDSPRFDSKASEWDSNIVRAALADAVSRAIIAHLPVTRPENALEIGCGTGLVTMKVAPKCGLLTAVDTSREMLAKLEEKLIVDGVPNVMTELLDLADPESASLLPGSFDFVFSSMTLHHISDTETFLAHLSSQMTPGATLAIADLDTEDGLFHDDETEKVHHGFDRMRLTAMFESAGFTTVSFMTAHLVEKKNRAGQQATYPVFLVTAVKPQS